MGNARFDFGGKVALVTGGASLLGAAIGRAFHAAGAAVSIADIDATRGAAVAAELGARALFTRCDVTDDAALEALVKATCDRFGGIDFLLNSAATFLDNGLDSSREDWLKSLNTNVVSGVRLTRLVAPVMKVRGGGSIVNFSSIAGRFGAAGRALYPASKAALKQVTRNEATELAPFKIRVNAISPAWTWSDPLKVLSGNDRARADAIGAKTHPLGRIGDAEEVADVLAWLCSDAASWITGADIPSTAATRCSARIAGSGPWGGSRGEADYRPRHFARSSSDIAGLITHVGGAAACSDRRASRSRASAARRCSSRCSSTLRSASAAAAFWRFSSACRAFTFSSNFRCIAASSSARLRFASSAARRASSSAGDAAAGTGTTAPGLAAAACWEDEADERARARLTLTPEPEPESASWSDFVVFLTFSALNAGSASRVVFVAAEDELLLDFDFTLTPFASAAVATIVRLATASATTRCLMAMIAPCRWVPAMPASWPFYLPSSGAPSRYAARKRR
jgi:NAD(P)-dependent dehydrogenase (short-subunit alcohol dehydrogenase family)